MGGGLTDDEEAVVAELCKRGVDVWIDGDLVRAKTS